MKKTFFQLLAIGLLSSSAYSETYALPLLKKATASNPKESIADRLENEENYSRKLIVTHENKEQ